MKCILGVLLLLLQFSAGAQENENAFDGYVWKAPYTLPISQNWTIERFLIPITFAPEIPYKSVEDIRFIPGWSNVKKRRILVLCFCCFWKANRI